MSETVHYNGILTKVERLQGETLEELCKRILNKELETEYYDSFQEMLRGECYEKYIVIDDILYSVEIKDVSFEDVFEASYNQDGNINFQVKYYNGGCSFNEAIEIAFKKLRNKK